MRSERNIIPFTERNLERKKSNISWRISKTARSWTQVVKPRQYLSTMNNTTHFNLLRMCLPRCKVVSCSRGDTDKTNQPNKLKKNFSFGLLFRQVLTNRTRNKSFKAPLLELNLLEYSTYSGLLLWLVPTAWTERENNESFYMAFAFWHVGIFLK